MTGWTLLAAALGANYIQHRRHKATICSVSRRLPRPLLLAGYTAGAVSLGVHIAKGYARVIDAAIDSK